MHSTSIQISYPLILHSFAVFIRFVSSKKEKVLRKWIKKGKVRNQHGKEWKLSCYSDIWNQRSYSALALLAGSDSFPGDKSKQTLHGELSMVLNLPCFLSLPFPSALGLRVSTHCQCHSRLSGCCCNHHWHTATIMSQAGEIQAATAVNMSFLLFQYKP